MRRDLLDEARMKEKREEFISFSFSAKLITIPTVERGSYSLTRLLRFPTLSGIGPLNLGFEWSSLKEVRERKGCRIIGSISLISHLNSIISTDI